MHTYYGKAHGLVNLLNPDPLTLLHPSRSLSLSIHSRFHCRGQSNPCTGILKLGEELLLVADLDACFAAGPIYTKHRQHPFKGVLLI